MTDTGHRRRSPARTDLFSGVTGILTLRGTVNVQSQAKTLTILGVMANYGEVRKNMRILRGRFIDEDDMLERARVAVVNRTLYEQLFANDESTDKTIRTLGTTFQVIGEFEEPVDTLGRGEVVPETILIPVIRRLVLHAHAAGQDALRRGAQFRVAADGGQRRRGDPQGAPPAGFGLRGREHDDRRARWRARSRWR